MADKPKRRTNAVYLTGGHRPFSESYIPDDATSGTSDFDEKDDDPEDCFCESGDVARKGIVTKVDNIGFDTLYHGDTTDLPMTLELTKPFFLTPSIGMASIFCGRPTDEDLHKLIVQYKIASPKTNRQYKEWNDPKVLAMKEPLKQINVIIEGAPEIDKPITMTKSGFIYVLKLTPEYKELLYKSSAMSPNEYFMPEGNTIKFSEKIPVTLNVRIIGRPRPQSWGPLTNPNKYNTEVKQMSESYEPLSEFDHFFVEGYPQALKQKQEIADKMKNSGDLSEIKSTVRKFIKPSGEIILPDPEHQRIKYGKRTPKEYTTDSYKKAYEYVKPIYDEFVDSQRISPGHNRSVKKQLFDICGMKDPDQHVIVIPDHKWGNDISFSIIKKKQCHLYKVTKNTRFIHFSDNSLSSLIPTCKSRPFNGHCYIYPTSRCYFWAIEGAPPLAMVQYAHSTYGDEIYEYKPKATDKFYIDQSDSRRYPNCTPVFIETKNSLSVTKVTDMIDDNVDRSFKFKTTDMTDNEHVNEEYKRTVEEIDRSLLQKIRMKESTKSVDRYNMILDKLESEIEINPKMIDAAKKDCKSKYPNATNLGMFDEYKKKYIKKAEAVVKELKGLIHKANPVMEGCDNMPLSEFDHYFQEAKMKAKTRKELDDSDFALVYKDASGNKIRKYPINDEAHVKAAARMFPRGVPNKYRKEVAGKILRRAHKFGIDTSGWKSLNAANEKD